MPLIFEMIARWLPMTALRVGEFILTVWIIRRVGDYGRKKTTTWFPTRGPIPLVTSYYVAAPVCAALLVLAAERAGLAFLSTRAIKASLLFDGGVLCLVVAWWLVLAGAGRGLLLKNSVFVCADDEATDPLEAFFDIALRVWQEKMWCVRPFEFRKLFRGDVRKLSGITISKPDFHAETGLSTEDLMYAPHLALGLPDTQPNYEAKIQNRTLYQDLPDHLYAAARALCENAPQVIANQWQLFHLHSSLRLRFVALFNTADLVQRHTTIRVLATLLDRDAMPPSLVEKSDFLRQSSLGDWNRTLGIALEGSSLPVFERLRRVLLDPRDDFDSAMALLEPLWKLLPFPVRHHGTHTLALWEVLGELRNRFTGHGPLGLLMAATPLRYIGCLHRFFLTAMRDLVEMDLGVAIMSGRKVASLDRGFRDASYHPNGAVFADPGDGELVNLYPYLLPSEGRLLTLNRVYKTEADYVDFAAASALEASFVRQDIPAAFFKKREWQRVADAIIVSSRGDGHCRSIAEAVRSALPGERILVRPGAYRESIVIDREVEIFGEGPVEEVVVENADSSCIWMSTERALVRGLTLRCTAGAKQEKCFTVNIPTGRLILEDCDVTSDSLSSVGIHGPDSDPAIRRCRLHDGNQGGVYAYDQSRGVIEDCDIHTNAMAGVEIARGANPIVRRCKIHDGNRGVRVQGEGQGRIEDCDIYGNSRSGVEISAGANPIISRCKIHAGERCGVFIHAQGKGTLEDCEIYENSQAGMEIAEQARPTLRRCIIRDGKGAGVLVRRQGEGEFEDCQIHSNSRAGVEIRDGGAPILRRTNIFDGKGNGVFVHAGGRGKLENCDIYSNALAGVGICEGGNPIVSGCRIHDGKQGGAMVYEAGRGVIEGCGIYANTLAGVEIREGGDPIIYGCQLHSGKSAGVFVHRSGHGRLNDCEIYANALGGIIISEGSDPMIHGSRIHSGQNTGISIYDDGRGTVEGCEIYGNAFAGITIGKGGNPIVRRCIIRDCKKSGVFFRAGGQGTIDDCEIYANALAGVMITEGSDPTIRRTGIHDGKEGGVLVHGQGRGTLGECQIYGNALAGVEVRERGDLVIRGCRIQGNGREAVWTHKNAAATVENCDLTTNVLGPWKIEDGCTVNRKNNIDW